MYFRLSEGSGSELLSKVGAVVGYTLQGADHDHCSCPRVKLPNLLIISYVTSNTHVFPQYTRDQTLASVTVGVVTVVSEDDFPLGHSSTHLQPISTAIVLEGRIVMEDIKDLPHLCTTFKLPKMHDKHT